MKTASGGCESRRQFILGLASIIVHGINPVFRGNFQSRPVSHGIKIDAFAGNDLVRDVFSEISILFGSTNNICLGFTTTHSPRLQFYSVQLTPLDCGVFTIDETHFNSFQFN